MANFLDRLINRKPKSAVQAKERLKFVLIHDRSEIPPGVIDLLKDEIIDVISRRIEIDPDSVRIEISQEGRQQRLIADIPLLPVKRKKSDKYRCKSSPRSTGAILISGCWDLSPCWLFSELRWCVRQLPETSNWRNST